MLGYEFTGEIKWRNIAILLVIIIIIVVTLSVKGQIETADLMQNFT
jgi:hypothetical protein